MATVEYDERYSAAPPEKVAELEARVGGPLPASYREYLAQQDGGTLSSYNNEGVETIFGIGDVPEWASLWKELDAWGDVLPSGFLPVAGDAGGNLFCLSLRDDDAGSVWFWNHELEVAEDGSAVSIEVTRSADTWSTFLDSLKPVDA